MGLLLLLLLLLLRRRLLRLLLGLRLLLLPVRIGLAFHRSALWQRPRGCPRPSPTPSPTPLAETLAETLALPEALVTLAAAAYRPATARAGTISQTLPATFAGAGSEDWVAARLVVSSLRRLHGWD